MVTGNKFSFAFISLLLLIISKLNSSVDSISIENYRNNVFIKNTRNKKIIKAFLYRKFIKHLNFV